jgi:4-amino-4-deoxy-L-arabinose transferase-like glycosyltransferase
MESSSLNKLNCPLFLKLFNKRVNVFSLTIVLIVILAAFLRLFKISEHMEFLGDQGRDALLVAKLLKEGDLLFIGPQTSVGNMYLGPWYYYIMAPFLLVFNYNPVGPAVMVALTSLLTVYLIYEFSKKWFNSLVGIISALLFAISPVTIKYSSFSWNPNIMPLFSLLVIWFVWKIYKDGSKKYFLYLGISFALALNSHYLALLLFPPVLLYLVLRFFKEDEKKQFIAKSFWGLGIFILLMSPLAVFDIKHNFVLFDAFNKFTFQKEGNISLSGILNNFYNNWNLVFERLVLGKEKYLSNFFSSVFAFGILLVGLKKKYIPLYLKKALDKPFIYLTIWYLLGIIGLSSYENEIYDHYFGFLFPLPFILLSYLLFKLFNQKTIGKVLSILILLFLLCLNVKNNHLWLEPNRQLQTTKQVDKLIINNSDGKPFNLALLAKQNYDMPYRYFFYINGQPLYDLHDQITDQLFVICEAWNTECNPLGHPLWEIAAFGWAKIDQQWKLNGIEIFKLVPNEKMD